MPGQRYEPDEHENESAPRDHRTDDPVTRGHPLLVFDRDSVRKVDQAAIEEFGMPGIVLMENAARGLARVALKMLDDPDGGTSLVLIFCGSGNNGGDGYALARHLHNAGVEVAIVPVGEPRADSDAGINQTICRRMDVCEVPVDDVDQFDRRHELDLIVDAIFGTGLDRPVTGPSAGIIHWINTSGLPVLAVDVPSGLDCNTGQPLGGEEAAAVQATRTGTFVGLKTGFFGLNAQKYLGEVTVVDIGAPVELLQRFGRPAGVTHMEALEHRPGVEPSASSRR